MGATVELVQPPPTPPSTHTPILERRNKFPHASPEKCLTYRVPVVRPPCAKLHDTQELNLPLNEFAVLKTSRRSVQGSRFKQGGEDVFLRFLLIPLFFLPFIHHHVHNSCHVPSAGVRNRRNTTGACSLELCFSVEYLYF